MGGIKVGQPADITCDAYKGTTFHGHVISINPASQNTYALVPAQNATGNFVKVTQRIPVRISVDDQSADMPLRPGYVGRSERESSLAWIHLRSICRVGLGRSAAV